MKPAPDILLSPSMANPFRDLPAVHDILQSSEVRRLEQRFARDLVVQAVRDEIDRLRQHLAAGQSLDGHAEPESLASRIAERLERDLRPKLRKVINATGIILHTNLGRAPMADEAARAAYDAAKGYLNLELDLDTGKRSSRQNAVRELLCRITGAESATAVNNNAAATVIALRGLAAGKEVIVSRGQLVEIGGSFRIPEIMAVSGAILREVGTTNITRRADYENALTPQTAALMRIHTSNFRVSGFTKSVALEDLVALAKDRNLKVIDDVGSGALIDFERFGLKGEPIVRHSVAAGADLVLFSGDKLLGGPQAGIIVGKAELIQAIERDPLMRAFRLDKMTLAALETTLRLYLQEQTALASVPVLRMLGRSDDDLRAAAEALASRLRSVAGLADAQARPDVAYVGGGSLPDQTMKTWVVALKSTRYSDADFARRLRLSDPSVLGRLHDGQMLLDVRTIFQEDIDLLAAALSAAAA
jgi:L-seryl-tRNA(Ser) seleniumtransferase